MVSEAGHFLIEATTIKPNGEKLIVGTDSGFPQLIRPMFYEAYHQIENISNPEGELKKYDVVGNICESGDCFGSDRELSEVREGDILLIKNAGAYCYSMGGIYNLRPMPAEVNYREGRTYLSRRRKSYKEMVDEIIEESHLTKI
ncbi:MAG: hypothetical protein ABEI74_02365 [Candidatus Pacearchaeota archaeon]